MSGTAGKNTAVQIDYTLRELRRRYISGKPVLAKYPSVLFYRSAAVVHVYLWGGHVRVLSFFEMGWDYMMLRSTDFPRKRFMT